MSFSKKPEQPTPPVVKKTAAQLEAEETQKWLDGLAKEAIEHHGGLPDTSTAQERRDAVETQQGYGQNQADIHAYLADEVYAAREGRLTTAQQLNIAALKRQIAQKEEQVKNKKE